MFKGVIISLDFWDIYNFDQASEMNASKGLYPSRGWPASIATKTDLSVWASLLQPNESNEMLIKFPWSINFHGPLTSKKPEGTMKSLRWFCCHPARSKDCWRDIPEAEVPSEAQTVKMFALRVHVYIFYLYTIHTHVPLITSQLLNISSIKLRKIIVQESKSVAESCRSHPSNSQPHPHDWRADRCCAALRSTHPGDGSDGPCDSNRNFSPWRWPLASPGLAAGDEAAGRWIFP